MIRLMNSSMMPVSGKYIAQEIDVNEFARIIQKNINKIVSYIGYQDTIEHIANVSGILFPLSRQQTILKDGDTMLICKLRYRLANPSDKGKFIPDESDWEYFKVEYKSI